MQVRTRENPFGNNTKEMLGKVIRKPEIAKKILNLGGEDVRIIDIKPSKTNRSASWFVFKNDEKFQDIFEKVIDENKREREDDGYTDSNNSEIEELKRQIAELKKAVAEKG